MNTLGKAIAADTFRIERNLNAPIEKAWTYLVNAKKRSRWFNAGDDITGLGQDFEMHFGHHRITDEKPPARWARFDGSQPDMVMKVRVLAFEPPRLLRITWAEGGGSEVTFELTPQGDGTRLTLTHTKLASRKDMLDIAGGWSGHLDTLVQEIKGEPHPAFWTEIQNYGAAYEKAIPE